MVLARSEYSLGEVAIDFPAEGVIAVGLNHAYGCVIISLKKSLDPKRRKVVFRLLMLGSVFLNR